MASTNNVFSFKEALKKLPRGIPLSTANLREYGVSAFRASALARNGWLAHLARDVYMLPGDTLTRDGCLAFLGERIAGFHVGSKTALGWRGVRQNVAFQERLTLWGKPSKPMPTWFTERFDHHYQSTRLFNAKMPARLGLQPLPNGHPQVLVSTPERAILELLSDVGKTQSLEEARQLLETLHAPRERTLDELLRHTTRIKVVRLAERLAGDLQLGWAPLAKIHSERLGGGKRWVAVSKSGERLDLKRA